MGLQQNNRFRRDAIVTHGYGTTNKSCCSAAGHFTNDTDRFVAGAWVDNCTGRHSCPDSAEFAIALIFSLIVMYDATGVRLHAGKTATVLNMIITELPPDHPVSDTRPLRDSLGHTPLQVSNFPHFQQPVQAKANKLLSAGRCGSSSGFMYWLCCWSVVAASSITMK